MPDPTYHLLELVGTSSVSSDDAIRTALRTAAGDGRRIDWFEVTATRGQALKGEIHQFQVSLKVGIRLESQASTSPHPPRTECP